MISGTQRQSKTMTEDTKKTYDEQTYCRKTEFGKRDKRFWYQRNFWSYQKLF
jgi:hypothetical protein